VSSVCVVLMLNLVWVYVFDGMVYLDVLLLLFEGDFDVVWCVDGL